MSLKSGQLFVGIQSTELLGDLIANNFSTSQIVIVTDRTVKRKCLPYLYSVVPILRKAKVIAFEPGEASKNLTTVQDIWKRLIQLGADRKTLVINIGGGVVTDLGGFAAAAYKRGIEFINLPTSLLAQVDASVGGKVGVDFQFYKNEIGFFKQPFATLIDPHFLISLDQRQITNGYAEMLKHGLVLDKNHWNDLIAQPFTDLEGLEKLIQQSVLLKKKIVEKDPFDNGLRKCLNFGHTIGHGIESYFLKQGKSVLHGEAIAAGMYIEAFICLQMGILKKKDFEALENAFELIFDPLPLKVDQVKPIWKLMLGDKKNENGEVKMVGIKNIGNPVLSVPITKQHLSVGIQQYLIRFATL